MWLWIHDMPGEKLEPQKISATFLLACPFPAATIFCSSPVNISSASAGYPAWWCFYCARLCVWKPGQNCALPLKSWKHCTAISRWLPVVLRAATWACHDGAQVFAAGKSWEFWCADIRLKPFVRWATKSGKLQFIAIHISPFQEHWTIENRL